MVYRLMVLWSEEQGKKEISLESKILTQSVIQSVKELSIRIVRNESGKRVMIHTVTEGMGRFVRIITAMVDGITGQIFRNAKCILTL